MEVWCSVLAAVGVVVVARLVLTALNGAYIHFVRPGKKLTKYGKWAVVTGATDGIGQAMAFELARKGLDVLLISRTQAKLDATKAEIKQRFADRDVDTLAVDYCNVDAAARAKLEAALKGRDVGVLVNNVGMSYDHPEFFSQLPDDRVADLIKMNVESVLTMTRLVLPSMEDRKRGAIVNISSASALFPSPLLSCYSASKSFVELLSRSLNAELSGKRVHVQVQSPLYVTTKLAKIRRASLTTPTPQTYARAAVRAIGFESACSPYWMHDLMLWAMLHLPEFVLERVVFGIHRDLRSRALKKKTK